MNAQELRKKKILTTWDFLRIIKELAPVSIVKREDSYYIITDSTGLQTSHLYIRNLVNNLLPVTGVNFFLVDGSRFLDKDNRKFLVLS